MDAVAIDTTSFKNAYKVTDDGKFATYKKMPCCLCGKLTTHHDASMLWDGIPTPLCSEECYDAYWKEISMKCNHNCENMDTDSVKIPTRVGDVGEFLVHPREWLSMENDILFAPGDKVGGTLIEKDSRWFCKCRYGDEIEVLNPNGHYQHLFIDEPDVGKFKNNYKALIERFSNPLPGRPYPGAYLIEECAELIQALIHAERGRSDANPIKEMAHVITMIDALLRYWDDDHSKIIAYQQELIDRYLDQPNDGRHVEIPT